MNVLTKREFSIEEKLQITFGLRRVLPIGLRSSRGRLKFFVAIKKQKTLDLLCLITRLNWLNKNEIMLYLQKRFVLDFHNFSSEKQKGYCQKMK